MCIEISETHSGEGEQTKGLEEQIMYLIRLEVDGLCGVSSLNRRSFLPTRVTVFAYYQQSVWVLISSECLYTYAVLHLLSAPTSKHLLACEKHVPGLVMHTNIYVCT